MKNTVSFVRRSFSDSILYFERTFYLKGSFSINKIISEISRKSCNKNKITPKMSKFLIIFARLIDATPSYSNNTMTYIAVTV